MSVSVRLDPTCVFDIGVRTPETRMLVKEYVRAISRNLAVHAGRPPGCTQSPEEPNVYYWTDGNWAVGFSVTESTGATDVTIRRIELRAR
jgi:hypothetical protein